MAVAMIGTSGYDYRHWRDVLYPDGLPRSEWLAHYATRFPSVELDGTFYRLPDRGTARGWHDRVPGSFRFAVKMSRYGTHMRRLREPADWLARFLQAVEPLGDKLGPVLVQLPPRWHRDGERLASFLASVPSDVRIAVEFRDPDWLHESTYRILRDHGAALVIHDLIDDHHRITTADWTYLRFHGPDPARPYTGAYTTQALAGAARRIRRHLREGRDVHAYFDNDADGHAVRDAGTLIRYLGPHAAKAVGKEPAAG